MRSHSLKTVLPKVGGLPLTNWWFCLAAKPYEEHKSRRKRTNGKHLSNWRLEKIKFENTIHLNSTKIFIGKPVGVNVQLKHPLYRHQVIIWRVLDGKWRCVIYICRQEIHVFRRNVPFVQFSEYVFGDEPAAIKMVHKSQVENVDLKSWQEKFLKKLTFHLVCQQRWLSSNDQV